MCVCPEKPQRSDTIRLLGIHVDDGIYGGDKFFQEQVSKLESKYPFGSKKSRVFTFTGIDLKQNPDNSIELSQSQYVKNINPICIKPERRAQENEPVTEEERPLIARPHWLVAVCSSAHQTRSHKLTQPIAIPD